MRYFYLFPNVIKIIVTLFLVSTIFMLSACGKKGALYLQPDEPVPVIQPEAQEVIPDTPDDSSKSNKKSPDQQD